MDFRRSIHLWLALACLCAGATPAAAQTRDTIKPQPPLTNVPGVPTTRQPPADTPSAQQPAPSRPTIQLPDIRLPSLRPRTVAVPSLTGRTEAEARRILTGAGLVLGAVNELPVDRPAGTVFLQRPAAGTQAQRGASVAVTLARAPAPAPAPVRTATVPDVTGASLATAVRRIEAAGLRVGSVEGAQGTTARVSRQSAPAGETVPLGTAVRLSMTAPNAPPVVATRPPVRPPVQPPTQTPVQPPAPPSTQTAQSPTPPAARVDSVAVPDVGTLTLADARAALRSAGLGASVDAALADSASWTVASQDPAAGARVPTGGGVALSLAAPPAAVAIVEPAVVPPAAGAVESPPPVVTAPVAPVAAADPPRWPWMLLIVAILLAAAAAVGMRRLRARTPAAMVPVAVSSRVRMEAQPGVAVRGAPFSAGAPRLRMRTRQGTPVLSVAAAGPLFTRQGDAGE
jgi:beta-lactam-binding protein with PASTA domain